MKNFLIVSYRFKPPTPEIMEVWGKWWSEIQDSIVDSGAPLGEGRQITHDGVNTLAPQSGAASGYMIVKA